jgi:hypothetical protein
VREHEAEDLRLVGVDPGHRYLVVFVLDDETEAGRIITSASNQASAIAALTEPPEPYLGELLIDLEAAGIDEAVTRAYDDGLSVELDEHAVPFSADYVTFA